MQPMCERVQAGVEDRPRTLVHPVSESRTLGNAAGNSAADQSNMLGIAAEPMLSRRTARSGVVSSA